MDNEQNEKMGKFISDLRKSRGMTQKVLAEQLKVTDKAVSKWERGISCPDISLLIQILLVFSYAIAAFVCVICDYVTAGRLTWSLIVLLSLAVSWIVILPLFGEKEKMLKRCLMSLSMAAIPYLFILSLILDESVIFYMGMCITVVAVAGTWCVYGIFINHWDRKFRAGGYSALIALVVTWGINLIVSWFYHSSADRGFDNLINVISLSGAAILLFVIDFYLNRKSE